MPSHTKAERAKRKKSKKPMPSNRQKVVKRGRS